MARFQARGAGQGFGEGPGEQVVRADGGQNALVGASDGRADG